MLLQDEGEYDDDVEEDEDDDQEDLVNIEGDYVDGIDLPEDEEAIVQRFLGGSGGGGGVTGRSLADVILSKIREKEAAGPAVRAPSDGGPALAPKVSAVNQLINQSIPSSASLYCAILFLPSVLPRELISRSPSYTPIVCLSAVRSSKCILPSGRCSSITPQGSCPRRSKCSRISRTGR